MSIAVGDQVPDFSFEATSGVSGRLQDYRGKTVILYFYPKDSTPGCTQEGKDFRDLHESFQQRGVVIFGLSRDSLKKHENFKAKHEFPFELISDENEELCRLFDVIKDKSMFGKLVRGIQRSTFIIDPNGTLTHEWRKVKVTNHANDVLAVL